MAHGRRELWIGRLGQWRESGLTARAFAARIGVKQGTLVKWKYRLAREQSARPDGLSSSRPVEFVELSTTVPHATVETSDTRLEVVCEGGRSVRVPRGFDAESLRRVVDVLERR